MCGFVGYVSNKKIDYSDIIKNRFKEGNKLITHRGPDSKGYFFNDNAMLGFSRLSIIDLEGGTQPMQYKNERYTIVFNGEIYNYIELKEELAEMGAKFSTSSDTEVLIASYAYWGEACTKRFRGMFTFLIWDNIDKVLFGARDMFGIKPLYYTENNDGIYFASEKKSILKYIDGKKLNKESLQQYFSYRYVPEPNTMHEDISKVLPGYSFKKELDKPIEFTRYWTPTFVANCSDKELLKKQIKDVLYDSVKVHMRSDVPVGCLLSSGIDSTIIAAISKEYNPDITTFTVGFDAGYNEIDIAKKTAECLNLRNIDITITAKDFMEVLPKMIWHFDDPLSDESAIALYFVNKEASKYVKVLLSGEGSDEFFGGYKIYRQPIDLKMFKKIPAWMKNSIKSVVNITPFNFKGKNAIIDGCTDIPLRYFSNTRAFADYESIANILKIFDRNLKPTDINEELYKETENMSDSSRMQYIDMYRWLTGDILLKADKMSMANSIELRVPFLDKEVFKVASTIKSELNFEGNTTKAVLREAISDIIPEHVVNRPKLGFPVPMDEWIRGEMHDWILDIIDKAEVDEYINKDYVIELFNEHCSKKKNNRREIWAAVTFMLYHQIFFENKYDISKFIASERQNIEKEIQQ